MKAKEGVEVIGWVIFGLLLMLGVYFIMCMLRDHDQAMKGVRTIPVGIATHVL